jgi:hypothetical protein
MDGLPGATAKTTHFVENVIYARTPYDEELFDIDLIQGFILKGFRLECKTA